MEGPNFSCLPPISQLPRVPVLEICPEGRVKAKLSISVANPLFLGEQQLGVKGPKLRWLCGSVLPSSIYHQKVDDSTKSIWRSTAERAANCSSLMTMTCTLKPVSKVTCCRRKISC